MPAGNITANSHAKLVRAVNSARNADTKAHAALTDVVIGRAHAALASAESEGNQSVVDAINGFLKTLDALLKTVQAFPLPGQVSSVLNIVVTGLDIYLKGIGA